MTLSVVLSALLSAFLLYGLIALIIKINNIEDDISSISTKIDDINSLNKTVKMGVHEIRCPICSSNVSGNDEPMIVTTRGVHDAIIWDINVHQFTCENKHHFYFDYRQAK